MISVSDQIAEGLLIRVRGVLEAAIWGVLGKKVFIEISKNSQENIYVRVSFLIKFHASGLQTLFKKRLQTQVFSIGMELFDKNS